MRLNFKGLNFPELSFRTNIEAVTKLLPQQKTEMKIESNFKRAVIQSNANESEKILSLTCRMKSDVTSRVPLDLVVTALGYFDCADFNQKEFEIRATSIIFPYIRTAVSNLMSLSGFPAITLPVLQDGILFPEDRNPGSTPVRNATTGSSGTND